MRETRVLVVTLMYRYYGPAIASWLEAFRFAGEEMKTERVRFDHLMLYGNPELAGGDSSLAILHKYNEARDQFLAGNYWAMITLEDDLIIPRHAFKRLIDMLSGFEADLSMGLYCFRHGRPKWNAALEMGDLNAGFLSDQPDQARDSWGRIIPVKGVGLGLTAIRRPVLETLKFRRAGAADNDWYFALDCDSWGFTTYLDMGLICGHYSAQPSPRVLWPDIDGKDFQRIEFLP